MINEPSKNNPKKIDTLSDWYKKIFTHAKEMKEHVDAQKMAEANPFPVEIFPAPIQRIISECKECLNFPTDYIGAAILYSISVCIGNTKRVELKKGHQESAAIYLAIVGLPGTTKTHALNFALKPIREQDGIFYKKYQDEKHEYQKILRLSKEEKLKGNYGEPVVPHLEQYLMSDTTIEAIASVLNSNLRGIGLCFDELLAWTKNFNRYSKGSEEQFFLSAWSGVQVRINRKTSEPILIPMPFLSLAGGIQTAKLPELAKSMVESGGVDRLLWAIPKDIKRTPWSKTELQATTLEDWSQIISNLLGIKLKLNESFSPKPDIVHFTNEAKELLFEWQRKSVELGNKLDNIENTTFLVKSELYAIRLALILHMAKVACNIKQSEFIEIDSVQGAIKLVDYFNNNALQVRSWLSDENPLSKLPKDKQNIYHLLPDEFATKEGLNIATDNGMAERTFKRLLTNKELFGRNSWGGYEKLF